MEVTKLELSGLLRIRPKVFRDDRGWFFEPYNEARYLAAGVTDRFVQDNHSRSSYGTLRGLHYQAVPGQAKLVRVATGRILDVVADIRVGSSTFGRWVAVELDAEKHEQLYIPVGFAHGFCVLSEAAEVLYKVSTLYDGSQERTIAWNDPELGVKWPVEDPVLSERDRNGESLASYRARMCR
ncbi:MAG TPA: dTDP-4-dehydrorhamnose 3,5-epimerase [Polyangiaceae bacterium]|nr:dTDP-4-dehydrorhamnose 3,5-epimerase [Polyangiaceae bacterium]